MKNLNKNVKEVRLITGLGILDCKNALLKNNCNIKKSINYLRKKGISKAENKFIKNTNQGAIFIFHNHDLGVMLEINSETDFVSRDSYFRSSGEYIIKECFKRKINNLDSVNKIFKQDRIKLISILGENINFSKYCFLKGKFIHSYLHDKRIGVLVQTNIKNLKLSKKIAMHIAASNPLYIKSTDIPKKIFEEERKIQIEIVKKFNKPKQILVKIIEGRMRQFINKICLNNQTFILDSNILVKEYLKLKNFKVKNFFRFEVGKKSFF